MASDKFAGIVVCFTGFRDMEAEKYIKENGGCSTTIVNWYTNYLVCKNKDRMTTKMIEAKRRGIKILNVDEFNETFGWSLAKDLIVPRRKKES